MQGKIINKGVLKKSDLSFDDPPSDDIIRFPGKDGRSMKGKISLIPEQEVIQKEAPFFQMHIIIRLKGENIPLKNIREKEYKSRVKVVTG